MEQVAKRPGGLELHYKEFDKEGRGSLRGEDYTIYREQKSKVKRQNYNLNIKEEIMNL